jgi:hypothetical protein
MILKTGELPQTRRNTSVAPRRTPCATRHPARRVPVIAYQPETQFSLRVERLIFVNLYSIPTEMAKLISFAVTFGA